MDAQRRERLWQIMLTPTLAHGGWSTVCVECVRALASIEAAALTLRSTTSAQEILGASGTWAVGLEELQYTLGEGPGVEAFTDGRPVLATNLDTDGIRWPTFAGEAVEAGLAAMFALPLTLGAIRLGTFTLYRRKPGMLPRAEMADAVVLADLITRALPERVSEAEGTGHSVLARSVVSYQEVNMATGMIAATLNISLQEAFVRLRGYAYSHHRSVREVAGDVLDRRLRLPDGER